jgi:hypothetical protein
MLSCLCFNQSTAPLALQYIESGLQKRVAHQEKGLLLSAASICTCLLEDEARLHMPKRSLQDLCTIVEKSELDLPDLGLGMFTMRRCTNAIILLGLGHQYSKSESIIQLSTRILSSFCIALERTSQFDKEERSPCLAALDTALKEQEGTHVQLLMRVRTLLKADTSSIQSRDAPLPISGQDSSKDWDKANTLRTFMTVVENTPGLLPRSRKQALDSAHLSNSVHPEIVNLLHFLVSGLHVYLFCQNKLLTNFVPSPLHPSSRSMNTPLGQ